MSHNYKTRRRVNLPSHPACQWDSIQLNHSVLHPTVFHPLGIKFFFFLIIPEKRILKLIKNRPKTARFIINKTQLSKRLENKLALKLKHRINIFSKAAKMENSSFPQRDEVHLYRI